jgi:ubiquinone/menaquinone biosynthesis C-methylase UbiE
MTERDTQKENIKRQFSEKGETYFQENYLGKNPLRERRMDVLKKIFADLSVASKAFLDAGAGPAVLYEMITSLNGNYFASDISIDNLKAARSRVGDFPCVVADTCSLPFADSSFDIVASIGSVEYIEEWKKAIAELSRVLVSNGSLVVTFANKKSPARKWDEGIIAGLRRMKSSLSGKANYRRFLASEEDVADTLNNNGLRIEQVIYFNDGIFGYPFRKSSIFRRLEKKISPMMKKSALEFVVVAKKTG